MDNSRKIEEVLKIFSLKIREILQKSDIQFDRLMEIRLRAYRPLVVIVNNQEMFLMDGGGVAKSYKDAFIVSEKEIRETLEYISNYSLYAFEEEIKHGYITVLGGHRVGLCGKGITRNGEITTIKYISFINVRVSHEIKGCADSVMDKLINMNKTIENTLIISPPRMGKTTLIRDIVRIVSNGNEKIKGQTVGLIDERSEIAACYLGIPQNDVGFRTDVLYNVPKDIGINIMVRTMSPEVIAVDEIGTTRDYNAIISGINCGCRLIATIHGDGIEDVLVKKELSRLIYERVFKKIILIKQDDKGNKKYEVIENNYVMEGKC